MIAKISWNTNNIKPETKDRSWEKGEPIQIPSIPIDEIVI